MQYYSTNDHNNHRQMVSFEEAVTHGLAPDGGLYMPERLPGLGHDWFKGLHQLSFVEMAHAIARPFTEGSLDDQALYELLEQVLTFDAPLVPVRDDLWVLELFHGPTLAFKDFGARFMARVFSHFNRDRAITILAATSGDTGSAVAHGFLGIPGIRVVLLYPAGKISPTQEMQMATIGQNVVALEVSGTFDDCQALVKRAFGDVALGREMTLSSANSINIARLIPQAFYYARALAQLKQNEQLNQANHSNQAERVHFVVPSGNFGNLTAGLFLKRMGAPMGGFVAATNANHVVPDYLTGHGYTPRPSVTTCSNAMDVGNPSNFARMLELYRGNAAAMSLDILAGWASDAQTLDTLRLVYEQTGYVLDPHAAVGVHVWDHLPKEERRGQLGMVLGTAHPAKFSEVVRQAIDVEVPLPERLASCLHKEKRSIPIANRYDDLVAVLREVHPE
jgi:threonine synthase